MFDQEVSYVYWYNRKANIEASNMEEVNLNYWISWESAKKIVVCLV